MSRHPTPDYYQHRVGGVLLDPYRIARLYGMADDPLFSAMKKLLAAGQRGAKDKAKDVQDAIDALMRWQEMEREDETESVDASAIFNAPAGMEDAPDNEVVEPITDDDAEDAARVERCETCGAKVTTNRQGCPICGAPTCCYSCCSREELKRQLDEARARILKLRERRDWLAADRTALRERAEKAERERDQIGAAFDAALNGGDDACEELERVRAELAGVVDPEQLQRWRAALSASPTETLTNAICRVTRELAALRDRYRPRRQSEEPAPEDVVVLYWCENSWLMSIGSKLRQADIWTRQPPAPEPERRRDPRLDGTLRGAWSAWKYQQARIADLTRERDMLHEVVVETARELGCEPDNEAMLERARDLARQNEHRQADLDALVRKHADLTRQLAEARALLAERKWNPTEHPQ